MKALAVNLRVLAANLFVALLLAETATRLFFPFSPGAERVALDGQPVADWHVPGSVYQQVAR